MSDQEYKELENHTLKIFTKHCYNLKKECAIVEKKTGKTKALDKIKREIKILCTKFYHFDMCTFYDVCIYRLNRLVHHMEKLEIKLAKLKGNNHLNILKRQKVVSFCHHVNMSIAEVILLEKNLEKNNELWYINEKKMLKQLLQLKRKMILIFQMETNWDRFYLKQVKRYKTRAYTISCYTLRFNALQFHSTRL